MARFQTAAIRMAWLVAVSGLVLNPGSATAQTPSTQDPVPPTTGPLQVERIEDGYVIAPEARITEIDGRTGGLAGGYGGWLIDRSLLVGGAGYWLANRDDDFKVWYGGLMVEWQVRGEDRIGFGVRGLAGGGSATLGTPLADLTGGATAFPVGHVDSRGHGRGPFRPGRGFDGDTIVLVSESFFVLEPQANLVWHMTRWCQVNLGTGYRVTAGAGRLDDRLRGASGSLAIQFGGR